MKLSEHLRKGIVLKYVAIDEAIIQEIEQLERDAELVALLRLLPLRSKLVHANTESAWEVIDWNERDHVLVGEGNSPEEALRDMVNRLKK